MDPSSSTETTASLPEKSLASSMRQRLNALPEWPNTIDGPTIFRIPANLRKNKNDFIEPSVVSIGPYHHGNKRLALMEEKKWLVLKNIMSKPKTNVTLEACVEKIEGLLLQARNCYSESVKMDDDSFVEMLILDGTFIIQFISKSFDWFKRGIGWSSKNICTDLIMLENQIPFFVVESLWVLYFKKPITLENLNRFKARLCSSQFQSQDITIPQNGFHHLLHLCYHVMVPDMSAHESFLPGCFCLDLSTCMSSEHKNTNELIPCATELRDAGIKLRKKKSPCKMMDVTFHGGLLEIPLIQIYDETKTLIINLLALEQNWVSSVPRHLISYIHFMDSIINTEHDVAILQRHGIIENYLSSEEEVALFFNQLCIGASKIEGDDYLSDLIKEVNRYYDSKCHRYRAKLMRDYFNSPWSLISFIAAVIILGLTFAQTYFAGDAYFHPSPN